MAKVHFKDEFKRDAVAQIVERGYSADCHGFRGHDSTLHCQTKLSSTV
jgi:transposase-like protein